MLKTNIIPFFKKHLILFVLFFIIIFLELIKYDSNFIENYYSTILYKESSNIFLYIFGKLPFSVGDILYLATPLIIYSIIDRNNTRRKNYKNLLYFFITVYLIFQYQWGLNYHRTPLKNKLLIEHNYDTKTLIKVTDLFIRNTNNIHYKLSKNDSLPVKFSDNTTPLYIASINAVQTLEKNKILNEYAPIVSVKNSLFSTPLSYMGFSGYINPFTLEAQINKNIPKIHVPTTICHEIAHQMGYSAENEANFIGIMATIHSENNLVSYSGNTLALRYLLNELYKSDKKSHHLLISKVNKGILINFIEANKEWEKYNNPFEPYFKGLFDYFLKVNNQTEGVKSYNLVVNLLVNYYSN